MPREVRIPMKGKEVYRVGISGSYGGMNLGDEAILQAMVSQMRETVPVEITVFSKNPEDTLRRHRVERAVPVRETLPGRGLWRK